MKGICTIVLLSLVIFGNSQNFLKPKELRAAFFKNEATYNCEKKSKDTASAKVINERAFDTLLKTITSRVIVSNDDLVKNGKAAALDFSEATKKLSINYNILNKNEGQWNFSFKAEAASNKAFELFGKNSWAQGMGLSLGYTNEIWGRSVYFYPEDCKELQYKRQQTFPYLIARYYKLSDTIILEDSLDKILQQQVLIDSIIKFDTVPFSSLNGLYSRDDLNRLTNQRDSMQMLKNRFLSRKSDAEFYERIVDEEVAIFEGKNSSKFGFGITWFNLSGGFDFKTFNIYDQSILTKAEVKKKDAYRYSLSFNLNRLEEWACKTIFYTTVGIKIGNTNYLEELLPDEIEILKAQTSGGSIVEKFDALVLKDYDKLKKNYHYLGLSLGGDIFLGEARFFGFELNVNPKFKVFVPNGIDAHHTITFSGGPLFSFQGKDKLAKTTFGIIASANNLSLDKMVIKDRFTIGVRIGVPFNF